jgi:hypothetical protein
MIVKVKKLKNVGKALETLQDFPTSKLDKEVRFSSPAPFLP